jgi:hypothetical protein
MKKFLSTLTSCVAATILLAPMVASADITAVEGAQLTSTTATEQFFTNSLTNQTTWVGMDITAVTVGENALWVWPQGVLYQNPTHGYVGISLTSGGDFDAIQITVTDGWGQDGSEFIWIRAFNDGAFTGFEFDLDLIHLDDKAAPGIFTVASDGTKFDELRVTASYIASIRDEHDLINNVSALRLNEIQLGSVTVDIDGDGVLDGDDNCPNAANPGQEDQDGDDVGDACDDDIDGDGVDNDDDNCPIDVNAGQEDFDGDTIGDACDDDIDGDTVANADDFCPDNTVIHEGVPTMGYLKPNHWALTVTGNRFDFDTVTKGKGPNRSYTIEDTAGCSCEQIIEIHELGDGHMKHGCSISAMDDWLDFVNP